MVHRYEVIIGGRALSIESGKLAGQANGAVTVRYGDTLLLATATASRQPRPDIDFFPLTVDYEERQYAAGKIPGGFFKREGRPSETAILTMRLTDRPIRPLFPSGFRNDVQVCLTALSADQENDPALLAIIGASTALSISDIPFEGPVGAVRVGYIDGQFVLNPLASQLPDSELELVVAGTADAVVMVEAGANELPEDLALDAIKFGQSALQDIIKLQLRMREAIGKPKFDFPKRQLPEGLHEALEKIVGDRLSDAIYKPEKREREAARDALRSEAAAQLGEPYSAKDIDEAIESLEQKIVRSNILEKGLRPDGRDTTTIRPLSCEVGVLPRTHGSGLFSRGQTQVLSIATLGSIGDGQVIDSIGPALTKRYMHHYNMPPYSNGEVRRVGSPGRREIGHGALAERAISAVLPTTDEFPYTIRVVSEVLSSNGSTSMASTCGSTLALMDAGVPIKAPVGGIAMGLIIGENGQFAVLTDIQGIEDHLGDMDFKVAGTSKGITALQMDVKVKGLNYEVLGKALEQAREARLFILDKMLTTIGEAREELSPFAPRIIRTSIPTEKIGALIGPGGRTIRGIQEDTGVKIDVEEDGSVFISSTDPVNAEKALAMVQRLTRDVELGGVYLGRVTRLTNFGAFVEVLPGKEGLVRLPDLAEYQVSRPEDVVSVGDEIMVKVVEIDGQGRVNLSRRAVLEGTPATSSGSSAPRRPAGPMPDRGPAPGPRGPRPERGPGGYGERRGGISDRGPGGYGDRGSGSGGYGDRRRPGPGGGSPRFGGPQGPDRGPRPPYRKSW